MHGQSSPKSDQFKITAMGAGTTHGKPVFFDFTAILDPIAAFLAPHPFQGTARHILRRDFYLDRLNPEQFIYGHYPVRFQLALVLVFNFGAVFFRDFPGFFPGGYPDGPAILEVYEGRRHNPVIKPFKGALAQTATGNGLNGVRGATVYLNQHIEFFAVQTTGVYDIDRVQTQDGHPDADYLTGADMAMDGGRFFKKFVECFQHGCSP
jgi:hypothetical protein